MLYYTLITMRIYLFTIVAALLVMSSYAEVASALVLSPAKSVQLAFENPLGSVADSKTNLQLVKYVRILQEYGYDWRHTLSAGYALSGTTQLFGNISNGSYFITETSTFTRPFVNGTTLSSTFSLPYSGSQGSTLVPSIAFSLQIPLSEDARRYKEFIESEYQRTFLTADLNDIQTRKALGLSTISAYFNLYLAEKQYELAQKRQVLLEKTDQETRARIELGQRRELDLLELQINIAQNAYTLANQKTLLLQKRKQFCLLLGLPTQTPITFPKLTALNIAPFKNLPISLDQLLSADKVSIESKLADLKILNKTMEAYSLEADTAPVLTVRTAASSTMTGQPWPSLFSSGTLNRSLSFGVSMPLYFTDEPAIKKQKYQLELQQVQNTITNQTIQRQTGWETSYTSYLQLKQNLDLMPKRLELQKKLESSFYLTYILGTISLKDYLDVQNKTIELEIQSQELITQLISLSSQYLILTKGVAKWLDVLNTL